MSKLFTRISLLSLSAFLLLGVGKASAQDEVELLSVTPDNFTNYTVNSLEEVKDFDVTVTFSAPVKATKAETGSRENNVLWAINPSDKASETITFSFPAAEVYNLIYGRSPSDELLPSLKLYFNVVDVNGDPVYSSADNVDFEYTYILEASAIAPGAAFNLTDSYEAEGKLDALTVSVSDPFNYIDANNSSIWDDASNKSVNWFTSITITNADGFKANAVSYDKATGSVVFQPAITASGSYDVEVPYAAFTIGYNSDSAADDNVDGSANPEDGGNVLGGDRSYQNQAWTGTVNVVVNNPEQGGGLSGEPLPVEDMDFYPEANKKYYILPETPGVLTWTVYYNGEKTQSYVIGGMKKAKDDSDVTPDSLEGSDVGWALDASSATYTLEAGVEYYFTWTKDNSANEYALYVTWEGEEAVPPTLVSIDPEHMSTITINTMDEADTPFEVKAVFSSPVKVIKAQTGDRENNVLWSVSPSDGYSKEFTFSFPKAALIDKILGRTPDDELKPSILLNIYCEDESGNPVINVDNQDDYFSFVYILNADAVPMGAPFNVEAPTTGEGSINTFTVTIDEQYTYINPSFNLTQVTVTGEGYNATATGIENGVVTFSPGITKPGDYTITFPFDAFIIGMNYDEGFNEDTEGANPEEGGNMGGDKFFSSMEKTYQFTVTEITGANEEQEIPVGEKLLVLEDPNFYPAENTKYYYKAESDGTMTIDVEGETIILSSTYGMFEFGADQIEPSECNGAPDSFGWGWTMGITHIEYKLEKGKVYYFVQSKNGNGTVKESAYYITFAGEEAEPAVVEGHEAGWVTQDDKTFPYNLVYSITYNSDKTITLSGEFGMPKGEPIGWVTPGIGIAGVNIMHPQPGEEFVFTNGDGTPRYFNEGETVTFQFSTAYAGGSVAIDVPYTVGDQKTEDDAVSIHAGGAEWVQSGNEEYIDHNHLEISTLNETAYIFVEVPAGAVAYYKHEALASAAKLVRANAPADFQEVPEVYPGYAIEVNQGDAGTIHICYDLNGETSEPLTFTYEVVNETPTGVEGIEVEDAEGDAVYYNLEGVKVANPANGLYIKVKDGKAVKVIVNK